MDLCQKKRGEYVDLQVLDDVRMMMVYQMPLSEIIYDFFDKMNPAQKDMRVLIMNLVVIALAH